MIMNVREKVSAGRQSVSESQDINAIHLFCFHCIREFYILGGGLVQSSD